LLLKRTQKPHEAISLVEARGRVQAQSENGSVGVLQRQEANSHFFEMRVL